MRLPHPLVLLTAAVFVAAAATHVLPAGAYDRREDPGTGREVVVSGTYHAVARDPVGPFEAVVAIPLGLADAASVVFLIFLIGGAFAVVDETGAFRRVVRGLAESVGDRRALVIPVTALLFATGGALENMQEEIIALIPVMLLLTRRLGYDAVTAMATSGGTAMVASAFSPINPFQVGIAQQVADLPLLSGGGFRTVVFAAALAVWIAGTIRYARRTAGPPESLPDLENAERGGRHAIVLGCVLVAFGVLIVGLIWWEWGFDEMSALFFLVGIVAGVVAGLGVAGTADAFVRGFQSMTHAALLVGFARSIYVVLEQGHVIDTIVRGLFFPAAELPVLLSAFAMLVGHIIVHVPVPSVSGHAVLTMPIVAPLSDLLGMSRQVSVLAYQYGGGLTDLMTPTNGALMALLATAGVRYERWLRFAWPLYASLLLLGAVAIAVAVAVGLQ